MSNAALIAGRRPGRCAVAGDRLLAGRRGAPWSQAVVGSRTWRCAGPARHAHDANAGRDLEVAGRSHRDRSEVGQSFGTRIIGATSRTTFAAIVTADKPAAARC